MKGMKTVDGSNPKTLGMYTKQTLSIEKVKNCLSMRST